MANHEKERKEHLRIAKRTFGKELEERFAPGSHGHHELMHLAWVQADVFEQYLLGHPATALHKDLFAKASEICEAMYRFYQMVAQVNARGDDA